MAEAFENEPVLSFLAGEVEPVCVLVRVDRIDVVAQPIQFPYSKSEIVNVVQFAILRNSMLLGRTSLGCAHRESPRVHGKTGTLSVHGGVLDGLFEEPSWTSKIAWIVFFLNDLETKTLC